MYILPMILGRTFDARFDRVGIDIFPQSELEKARTLLEPESVSRYETTDSAKDVRNLLEVPTDIALKVKGGKLDMKGTGSYLKDTSRMGRVIEILTRLKFKTVSVALPPEVQPFVGWSLKNRNDLGTHFVRSVTYGGELLASIRFKANKEEDFTSISSMISGNFSGGDATSLVAEGKLESLQSSLKDKASMEISYYATVPLKGVPNTIDGLRNLVKGFDQHVKEVNDGWGVPIRVELMELSSLGGVNSSQFQFLKNRALESELADVEHEFDDLKKAQTMITDWYRSLPTSITKEQEEKINKLYERIQKILRPYYDSIGKLNIEEGPEKQIQEAREAYREGKFSALPGKFTKEFNKLIKSVVVKEKKIYGTGSGMYVHWGSRKCPQSPMVHQLSTGYISATTNRGTGGSSDYICLPDENEKEDNQPKFGLDSSPIISGARYGMMDENPFSDSAVRYYFAKGMPCATCHLTNRTLIHVSPAEEQCPEGWIYEYSGFLMAGSNLPGRHMCIDENPEAFDELSDEQQSHSTSIVHISDNDGGLKKPPYEKKAAIQCIVCSK